MLILRTLLAILLACLAGMIVLHRRTISSGHLLDLRARTPPHLRNEVVSPSTPPLSASGAVQASEERVVDAMNSSDVQQPTRHFAATRALLLPHKATCIELADVRTAYLSCQEPSKTPVRSDVEIMHGDDAAASMTVDRQRPRLLCARSLERLCVKRAVAIAKPRCAMRIPLRTASEATFWSTVAFGMAVHDADDEKHLLQAAADTWLRMTLGADLVLMTDADDVRNASTIAPRVWGQLRVHVYRCADCRGQRCNSQDVDQTKVGHCTGVREGWLARRKVLHLFVAMAQLFVIGGGGSSSMSRTSSTSSDSRGRSVSFDKHFFVKLDADTVLVPHNLRRLLVELRSTLGDEQPYFFGMAACRVASFPLCHAAGGAGYGLSREALVKLTLFLKDEYPGFLERVDRFTYGGEDVTVAFALKKKSGIAVLNVGCLYQHSPLKYQKLHAHGEEWVQWPLSTTPVSFHKFKDADELRTFYTCSLYDEQGRPRPAPRALLAPHCTKQEMVTQPHPPMRHELAIEGGMLSIAH